MRSSYQEILEATQAATAFYALSVWLMIVSIGMEEMGFYRIFFLTVVLASLFIIQATLKKVIQIQKTEEYNVAFQKSIVRELEYLKEERNWGNNQNLENALKEIHSQLNQRAA